MPVVALACCRLSGEAPVSDLYPDGDPEQLADALRGVGLDAVAVSWDDPDFDWASVAGVLVRSTWDSVDRPEEYSGWARRVGALTVLLNSADVIEWNLNKTYLHDLAAAGVEVVPTEWVLPGSSWVPGLDQDLVIKPSVSAGGRETAWYSHGQVERATAHVTRLFERGQTVLVQPYLASVQVPGEVDLIYIDGRYSHAVRKGPLLERDAGTQARPWERMTSLGLAEPTDAEHALGASAIAAVTSRFGIPTYGRVDLVELSTGGPAVLEVELIDPNLSLVDVPSAPSTLATAVLKHLYLP